MKLLINFRNILRTEKKRKSHPLKGAHKKKKELKIFIYLSSVLIVRMHSMHVDLALDK